MNDTKRIDRLVIVVTVLCFIVTMLCVSAAAHAKPRHKLTWEQIAFSKCGPEGTVDWDDNPNYPPPHCNRNGWNGHRYVKVHERRSLRSAALQGDTK